MNLSRVLIQLAYLVAILFSAANSARLQQESSKLQLQAAAVGSSSRLRAKGRTLQAAASYDNVCYEGCYSAPPSDPMAPPLPFPLYRAVNHSINYMQLLDCFLLAEAAHLTYFAIYDLYDCYGGNETQPYLGSWGGDDCPLDCQPSSGNDACGGRDKAAVFKMGTCIETATSCDPAPPPAAVKRFRCKPGIALWGTELPSSPIKLSTKAGTANNTATCEETCATDPACAGYYYKETGWCYLLSEVKAWGKKYKTAVQACRAA